MSRVWALESCILTVLRNHSRYRSITMFFNNFPMRLSSSMNNPLNLATPTASSIVRKDRAQLDKEECASLFILVAEVKQECKICLQNEPKFNKKTFLNASVHEMHNVVYLAADRLLNLLDNTSFLQDISEIYDFVALHDYKTVRANGYRTFMCNIRKVLLHILPLLRNKRFSILNWNRKRNDLVAYVLCLEELALCVNLMKDFPNFASSPGSLFPQEFLDAIPKIGTCDPLDLVDLRKQHPIPLITEEQRKSDIWKKYKAKVNQFDTIRQENFYGRCIAYYYVEPATNLFTYLGSIMAGAADSFSSSRAGITALMNTVYASVMSYLSPEDRGRMIAKVTRNADVSFCKTFWSLAEMKILTDLPTVLLPSLSICRAITLSAMPLQVPLKNGQTCKLPPPRNKNGDSCCVEIRVLSKSLHHGQAFIQKQSQHHMNIKVTLSGTPSKVWKEPSSHLVMHIHGGGFVALSSEAHDVYLRPWADFWDCPVISVNYSLAPEAPYPQALDECFFAYCWATENLENLGCTPDARIVICGDSAGGNLTMGVSMRAAALDMKIQPAGACIIYAPLLISCRPSPARMLSISDPMLPLGILPRCMLAYSGIDEQRYLQITRQNSVVSMAPSNANKPQRSTSNRSASVPNLRLGSQKSSGESTHLKKVRMPNTPLAVHSNSTENVTQVKSIATDTKVELGEEAEFVEALTEPGDDEYDPAMIYQRPVDPNCPLRLVRECPIPQDSLKSPLLASDELLKKLPPIGIVLSHTDCFLDDGIEMAKRLDAVGGKVALHVVEDLPHAFLNFCFLGGQMQKATDLVRDVIKQLLTGQITGSQDELD